MKLLIGAVGLFLIQTAAYAQGTVYKCSVNGQVVYSGSPCDKPSATKKLDIKDDRMGNVTYGRRTYVSSANSSKRELSPEQKEKREAAEKKKKVCETVRTDLDSFNLQLARANTDEVKNDMQNRREKAIKTSKDWGC